MKRIPAGNVVFVVETREGGSDGGPSIQVLATVDGAEHQLLRLDCFHKRPHYHYDPMGKDERYNIDPTLVPNSLGWVILQLRANLPSMIARSGHASVAAGIDRAAVIAGLDEAEAYFGVASASP